MSRHIIDTPKQTAEGPRVKRFVELQRREGIHPNLRALNKRSHGESLSRVTQYLRIERNETA